MLIDIKDIQAVINSQHYCTHPGKSDDLGLCDTNTFLMSELMKQTVQKNGFALFTTNKRSLLTILRELRKIFGPQIRDVGINKKYIARVKAVNNGKFYINTSFSQPLHSDEGYRTVFPRFVSLYCIKPSTRGGVSTIVVVKDLVARLRKVFKDNEVENLYCPSFIQIDTMAGKISKQLLFHLDDDAIGMSYSPVLKGLRTSELGYDMLSWINKFIHDPANQYRLSLKANELLLMDNCQVLHGRTGFNERDNRLLLRFWHESMSQ